MQVSIYFMRVSIYFMRVIINYPFYAMHIQALIVPRIDRFLRGTVSSHSDW